MIYFEHFDLLLWKIRHHFYKIQGLMSKKNKQFLNGTKEQNCIWYNLSTWIDYMCVFVSIT